MVDKAEQPDNIEFAVVRDDQSKAGRVVNAEQPVNIKPAVITEAVLNNGTDRILPQLANIEPHCVLAEVEENVGHASRAPQALNIPFMAVALLVQRS